MSHDIANTFAEVIGDIRVMTNSLTPRLRADIINYDPTQPGALSVTEFCRSLKVSRSVFYKIRARSQHESTAALHPRSRAPKQPARRYGPDVVNELVRIRKQLKTDGWDYGPKTIHYEAQIADAFPCGKVPSPATIARLLASVGHVEASPKKRPKSSYIPFARSTAMALWQLDAFEYTLTTGTIITIYQLLDDATRFDVGTMAHSRAENSADALQVLATAIAEYGAPKEVLSDNSSAFNQLRQGRIGTVETFLASKGAMPISGLPGKPTTQGKNERSHQTLLRFLDANTPASLEQVRALLRRFCEHYNNRRPHQSVGGAPPATAWNLLEHTPATEPIPMAVLEAKAAEYLSKRIRLQANLDQVGLAITKTGDILADTTSEQASDQSVVEVTRANHQVYYQGLQVSLPMTFAGRQFYRTITDEAFILSDMVTGEIVFSFPLPMVAIKGRKRTVASYAIRGVQIVNPTKQWIRKHAEYEAEFETRQTAMPEVFS